MSTDTSLAIAVAEYVQALVGAETDRAEDRPALQSLVINAAGLLAEAVLGNNASAAARVEVHERLRGHTWLQGVALVELDRRWATVRSYASSAAI